MSFIYRVSIGYLSGTYQFIYLYIYDIYWYYPICTSYLSDMYPIFIIIYRVPYMSMIYNRYFATRYVCYNHPISIIYMSDFLHKYYTYRLPDMCVQYVYSRHIGYISADFRYPICTRYVPDNIDFNQCINHVKQIMNLNYIGILSKL